MASAGSILQSLQNLQVVRVTLHTVIHYIVVARDDLLIGRVEGRGQRAEGGGRESIPNGLPLCNATEQSLTMALVSLHGGTLQLTYVDKKRQSG